MTTPEEPAPPHRHARGRERGTARRRLLDAAEELFATDGFAGTTTRAIAERAGTSTGMVFYHFPTKTALLETVLAERSPQADLADRIEGHRGDPVGLLRVLAEAVERTVEERGEVLRIMLRGEDPEHGELFRRYLDTAAETLGAQLERELAASQITASRARAIARSFFATVLVTFLIAPVDDPDRLIEDTILALLHGYV
ncbi:MAG: helix-turn-helix domain-containing protein [Nitriliruptoraceae bacterium]